MRLLVLLLPQCFLMLHAPLFVAASSGSSPFIRHASWRSAAATPTASFGFRPQGSSSSTPKPFNPRAERYLAKIALEEALQQEKSKTRLPPRGGNDAEAAFVKIVGTVTSILIQCGKVVLPPAVAVTKVVVDFYRALPKDAILAQVGLVYCFAGGYYPTLFSSLQAAQQCGWNVMVQAISELTDEAIRVIHALDDVKTSKFGFDDDNKKKMSSYLANFRKNTAVVMATVDPMKINQAAGALYTTWLGVSSVLEKEYARVITLSMTMARFIERSVGFILEPAAKLCVSGDYHQWIPVVIGWGCKAVAMNIAWRIQRIMTAGTSALAGGLMFARACARMLSKRGIKLFGLIQEDDESTLFDEVIGFMVAGLGFYTQFESQWRNGFSFKVPFPLSLITWPFDWAEKWIQWQITKD